METDCCCLFKFIFQTDSDIAIFGGDLLITIHISHPIRVFDEPELINIYISFM